MGSNQPQTFLCPVCKEQRPANHGMCEDPVSHPTAETIRKSYLEWSPEEATYTPDNNHLDAKSVQDSLKAAKAQLSELEGEVIRSLEEHEVLSKNLNIEFDRGLTFGERVADKVTEFGGSWTFIGVYVVVLIAWAGVNSLGWFWRPFDPYPYIFLNLVLSAVAAMQAPVILMSQNRQDAKDRLRSEHDYRVNLKAELEIRRLGAKMDKLLSKQWSRLLEIQQMQIELLKTSGCNGRNHTAS